MASTKIGKLPPRYAFVLNPYVDGKTIAKGTDPGLVRASPALPEAPTPSDAY